MLKKSIILTLAVSMLFSIIIPLAGCSKKPLQRTSETASTSSVTATTLSSTASPTSSASVVSQPTTANTSPSKTTTPPSTMTPTTPTPQEIGAYSIAGIQKYESFKFHMDFSLSFTLPTSTGTGTMTMQEVGTGSVNIRDKQMGLNMNLTMEIPNQGTQNVTAEIYLIDGWMYMKANVPDVGVQWTRMRLTDELWAIQSQILNMTDFLKAPLDLGLAGSEIIEGVDCYVLNISPDVNTLTQWMEGQLQSGQDGIDLSGVDMSNILQNFTVKEWIAKDSYLPVKQQIVVKLDMASLASGNSTPMNMEMSSTIIYYDYGKPVTFQLPPDAINATEITIPQ